MKKNIDLSVGAKFEDNGKFSRFLQLPFSFKQSHFKALDLSKGGLLGAIKSMIKVFFLVERKENGEIRLLLKLPSRRGSEEQDVAQFAQLPIQNNKIVFDNYMDKGFGGNPKYVAEQLIKEYPSRFDIVWITSKANMSQGDFPPGIRLVDYSSMQALQEYMTAKVWVSNYHKVSLLKRGMLKRPEQCFIQMWHGSLGIKRIENNVPGLTGDESWLRLSEQSSSMVDCWISNSSFETEVYKTAFWDVRTVKEYGHPRNDIFFDKGRMQAAREKVSGRFDIGEKKILLYAPTFREDCRVDCYRIDFEALQRCLQQRFGGEWVILVRLHPRVQKYAQSVIPDLPFVVDATYYADIQELIAGADCVITDYSSCIFDFMLTKRPAFIFATDISEYDDERGFYYPIASTPFPVAADNNQLTENVASFNEERYAAEVDAFLREKGCIEDGCASERVVQLIVEAAGQ